MNEVQAITVGVFLFQCAIGALLVFFDKFSEKNDTWQPNFFIMYLVGFLFGGVGELIAHFFVKRPPQPPKELLNKEKEKKPDKLEDEDVDKETKEKLLKEQEEEENEKKQAARLKFNYGAMEFRRYKRFKQMRIMFIVLAVWSFGVMLVLSINLATYG